MEEEELGDASKFRRDLSAWAETNLREFPWRDEDLSVYEAFIAEFFLTQTPAENTSEVYAEFIDRFPSLEHVAEASEAELAAVIEPIGFHNMRATALAQIARDRDELPEDVDGLSALPRVGPYVANATLCFARQRSLPIVDRNVNRVYRRLFADQYPATDAARRRFAANLLPDDRASAYTYNLALLDFGALVCTKRDPDCVDCFASDYCAYYQGDEPGDLEGPSD